jgi:hypothetical protein
VVLLKKAECHDVNKLSTVNIIKAIIFCRSSEERGYALIMYLSGHLEGERDASKLSRFLFDR